MIQNPFLLYTLSILLYIIITVGFSSYKVFFMYLSHFGSIDGENNTNVTQAVSYVYHLYHLLTFDRFGKVPKPWYIKY